jgi:hypothetical protein
MRAGPIRNGIIATPDSAKCCSSATSGSGNAQRRAQPHRQRHGDRHYHQIDGGDQQEGPYQRPSSIRNSWVRPALT